MSVLVSFLLILVGLAVFIVFSIKNVNLTFAAVIAAIVVCFSLEGGLTNLFTVYMDGMFGFMRNFFLSYIFAGVYGTILSKTGLGMRLGVSIANRFGPKSAPIALFIIVMLLMSTSVAAYQLIVYPIAVGLFMKANLPRSLAVAAMSAGAGSITYGILVGTTTAINIIPTTFLGTTTMAGVGMSIVCSLVCLAYILIYFNRETKRARAAGKGWETLEEDSSLNVDNKDELPPLWMAVLSLVLVIAICLVFQYVFKFVAVQALLFALLISIIIMVLLNIKRMGSLKELANVLGSGVTATVGPIITICSIIGFGTVVQQTSAYTAMVDFINSINLHPYIVTFLGVNILSFMAANGSAGSTLFMNSIGQFYAPLATVNAGALHRITSMAACGLDSMPWNGSIAFQRQVFHVGFKEGYRAQFHMSVACTFIAGIVGVIIGLIFY